MIVILEEQGRAGVRVCVCAWACVGDGGDDVIDGENNKNYFTYTLWKTLWKTLYLTPVILQYQKTPLQILKICTKMYSVGLIRSETLINAKRF